MPCLHVIRNSLNAILLMSSVPTQIVHLQHYENVEIRYSQKGVRVIGHFSSLGDLGIFGTLVGMPYFLENEHHFHSIFYPNMVTLMCETLCHSLQICWRQHDARER